MRSSAPPWPPHPRRGRWLLRVLLALAILIFAAAAAVRAYLPVLVQRHTQAALQRAFGESAHLADVDLSISRSSVTVEGFAIEGPAEIEEHFAFSFESLRVRLASLWAAARGDVRIAEFALVRPRVEIASASLPPLNLAGVWPRGGTLRRSDLGDLPPIDSLRIEGGSIVWRDGRSSPPAEVTLTELNADIDGLAALAARGSGRATLSLSGQMLDASAEMTLTGDFSESGPADFDLSLEIANLDVTRLRSHFADSALQIDAGHADVSLAGPCNDGQLDLQMALTLQGMRVRPKPGAITDRALDLPLAAVVEFLSSDQAREPVTARVRGDLSDSRFDLESAIQDAVRVGLRGRISQWMGGARGAGQRAPKETGAPSPAPR